MDPVMTKLMGDLVANGGGEGAKVSTGQNGSDFKQLLETQLSESSDSVKMVQEALGSPEGVKFKTAPAEQVSLDPNLIVQDQRTSVVHILSEVNESALQMDQMVEMATSGRSMSPQEMLALQAGMLELSHEITTVGQITASLDRSRSAILGLQLS